MTDGKWILYLGYGGTDRGWWESKPQPVLRIPFTGGAATALFTAKAGAFTISCARPPATICAISEPSDDGMLRIISTLDPLTGRGPELARLPVNQNSHLWWAKLSPDGTRIALSGSPPDAIHILSLRDRSTHDIKVRGWKTWYKPFWAADGMGFYVSATQQGRNVILYLDLHGNPSVVWEGPKATQETLAVPSPDGDHLAIQTFTENDNMWLMENF